MSILRISNTNDYFDLEGINILNLELEFNHSNKGKEWIFIGDYLHKFYVLIGYENQPESILFLENEQYDFIKELNNILLNK